MGTFEYFSNHLVKSPRIKEDFEPEGNPAVKCWASTERLVIEASYVPDVRFPESRTEVATAWTPSNLYVAFWCRFTELNLYTGEDPGKPKWELWDRDVVEVFVNPIPDRIHQYYEFEVAPNNLWIDLSIDLDRDPMWISGWASGFSHGTSIHDSTGTWFCDMRIPVSSLGVNKLREGEEWRINFYRCDGTGDDSRRRFLAWSPTFNPNFHTPAHFGRILFSGAKSS